MKAEMSVGNGMGRIASVSRTSGKAGRVAQILTPGAAIVTAPAAMPQPRNAHPVTRQEAGHPFSQRGDDPDNLMARRSEEHTSGLQSLMRISYAVFCLKTKNKNRQSYEPHSNHKPLIQYQSTKAQFQQPDPT